VQAEEANPQHEQPPQHLERRPPGPATAIRKKGTHCSLNLIARLAPGSRLTLVFKSALGEECRRHRIVEYADRNIVRLATAPPEKEPSVEIVFGHRDRIFLLRDGFVLVSESGICTLYVWGHV
jgi:hypothetical protein